MLRATQSNSLLLRRRLPRGHPVSRQPLLRPCTGSPTHVSCTSHKQLHVPTTAARPLVPRLPLASRRSTLVIAHATPEDKPVVYNKEFGYSRKDIILIGVGLIALGYALYYGLQATGMEAGFAGNWVQLIIFVGICIGWVSTYVWRVATKQMTYVKQLEQYEDAVMRRRLDEMTEEEMTELINEAEQDKGRGRPGR